MPFTRHIQTSALLYQYLLIYIKILTMCQKVVFPLNKCFSNNTLKPMYSLGYETQTISVLKIRSI